MWLLMVELEGVSGDEFDVLFGADRNPFPVREMSKANHAVAFEATPVVRKEFRCEIKESKEKNKATKLVL